MSDKKMREALEQIAALADKYSGEYPTQVGAIAREAIAADRAARAEPVGFVDANGDLIPHRKLQPWTEIYTAPPAAPVVLEADDLIMASLAASRAGLVPGTANWALFMQRKLAATHAPSQEPKQ